MADEGGLVKVENLARLLMLTPRRVQQLAKEGICVKATRGNYEFVASVQGYIRSLKDELEGKPGTELAQQVHAERLRSLQLDNDLKEGTTLSRDLVNEITGICMAAVARIADSLASRLPPLLSGDKTSAQRRLIIRNETRAIRETAARELRALGGVDDAGGHTETVAGKNGRPVGKSKCRPADKRRRARPVSNRADPVHGGSVKSTD